VVGDGPAFSVFLIVSFIIALVAETFNQWQVDRRLLFAVLRALGMTLIPALVVGIISGIGFRIILRIASWLDNDSFTAFTLSVTLMLIWMSVVLSAPFSLLFVAVRRVLPGSKWRKGLVYGLVLLLYPGIPYMFMPPDQPGLGNSLLFGVGQSDFFESWSATGLFLTRLLFAFLFLGHGILLAGVAEWLNAHPVNFQRRIHA
jgi:hypothetical protein